MPNPTEPNGGHEVPTLEQHPHWRFRFAVLAGMTAEWYVVTHQARTEAEGLQALLGSDWVKARHEQSGHDRFFAIGGVVAVEVRKLEGDELAEYLEAKHAAAK